MSANAGSGVGVARTLARFKAATAATSFMEKSMFGGSGIELEYIDGKMCLGRLAG